MHSSLSVVILRVSVVYTTALSQEYHYIHRTTMPSSGKNAAYASIYIALQIVLDWVLIFRSNFVSCSNVF